MLIVGLANARNVKNLKRKSFFALFANKGGYPYDQDAQGGEKKQNADLSHVNGDLGRMQKKCKKV